MYAGVCFENGARPDWVVNHTFELMDKLGASEHQLDFPIVYASALQGWATLDPKVKGENMKPLFDAILQHVPPPEHPEWHALRDRLWRASRPWSAQ